MGIGLPLMIASLYNYTSTAIIKGVFVNTNEFIITWGQMIKGFSWVPDIDL